MTDRIVSDSSPLIVLLKADLASLLRDIFSEVLVPEAVWDEIMAGPRSDVARTILPKLDFITRTQINSPGSDVLEYGLGPEECHAIALACETGSGVLIDDYSGRKCAMELGVPLLGTGGLLVAAKRRHLIHSVADELERVQEVGLWLSTEVVAMLLKKAGE